MNHSMALLPARNRHPTRAANTARVAPRVNPAVVEVARDVMTRDPDRVAGGDTLLDVAGRMRDLLVAFLPVCDRHGLLQRIIALQDLHRVIHPGHPTDATASSLARPTVTIAANDPVDQVFDLMAAERMWLLPVLDGRRLVGVIHYTAAHPPGTGRAPRGDR